MILRDILLHAGRAFQDTSPEFKDTVLLPAFHLVLTELASKRLLSALDTTRSAVMLTDAVRSYSAATLCGLTAPATPLDVLRFRVWAWGFPGGVIEKATDAVFNFTRALEGDTAGQPSLWRFHPNMQTIEFHKIPNTAAAAATVEVEFIKPPTLIEETAQLTEVQFEDLPAIVAGLEVHGVEHMNDQDADRDSRRQKAMAQWQAGQSVMAARAGGYKLTPRQRMVQALDMQRGKK